MNYEKIRKICEDDRTISGELVDKFLIYYAATKENLEREMDLRLKPYRHVVDGFLPEVLNSMKAQYIGHRIFKSGGLIKKYLKHSDIKKLDNRDLKFLERESMKAWKFSFSVIVDNPAEDFYTMRDVATDESYLLYSKGVTEILAIMPAMMWCNLIGFNDHCWQTFGPIYPYVGFDYDDLFFFATELNPAIESDEGLMTDVERNPIPYMVLFCGSKLPLTIEI